MINAPRLIFGTRASALARWQTDMVAAQLQTHFNNLTVKITLIATAGDKELNKPLPEIGGKGLFTAELETALRGGQIDLAVHSLKDLPTENAPGLTIGAILPRENPADALVSRNRYTLADLPPNAVIGTSSLRRAAQLLARRPDLKIIALRGNVDTRLKKALDPNGPYDAIILAAAGLTRLALDGHISQRLPFEAMLPAPGQGAVAVQCRADDRPTLDMLARLHHLPTHQAILAERAFLAGLGGGCSVPVGALATVQANAITLQGVVAAPDGRQAVRLTGQAPAAEAETLGRELAQQALAQGAAQILETVHA